MDRKTAQQIIEKTRQTYNQIAGQFSQTRQHLWPDLRFLKHYIKDRQKILDLGCGNGRLVKLFEDKKVDYLGIDYSKKLIKIARENHPNYDFMVGDILNLDLADNLFDRIFSIATLHHIPSNILREKALGEMTRVGKKDGLIIISVWNLKNKKWLKESDFPKVKKIEKSSLEKKDFLKTWDDNPKLVRYFYKFDLPELIRLVRNSGLKIVKSRESDYNLIVVARI